MSLNPFSKYGSRVSIPSFTGKTFFVSSDAAILTRLRAMFPPDEESVVRVYETIDAAVGACVADRGDVIMVAQGHTETVTAAAGLDLDVAGITIIGMGYGDNRPNVNFTTATTADMDVDANNITVVNMRFTGGVDALAGPIDVNATGFRMLDCEFEDVTGQTEHWVVAVDADELVCRGLRVKGAAADGADCVFQLNSCADVEIVDFYVDGNFDDGFIESVTAANTGLLVHTGYFRNRGAEDRFMTVQATDTGWVGGGGDKVINIRLADDAANIDEVIVQSDGTTITSDLQFVSGGVNVVNADNERTLAWTGVSASTDA